MIEIYYFNETLKTADISELQEIKDKYNIWIDITGISKDEGEVIKNTFDIHPLTIEDLINQNTRIKVEEFIKYIFAIFYGLKKNSNNELEAIELNYILGSNFLISSHIEPLPRYTELKNSKEKVAALLQKGPDFVMHKLIDAEIDDFEPILQEIDDKIENVELQIGEASNKKLMRDIFDIKHQLILIKKISHPQREKLSNISKGEYPFFTPRVLPYFRDAYDHAIRVTDAIESYKESINATAEIHMSAINNSMNEVMKFMTTITTIALPITAISGIYGTNFSYIPLLHTTTGFFVMLGMILAISLGMLYYFRQKQWI